MWKKVSTKILLEHKFGNIVEDIVELQSGKQIDYLKYEINANGVCIIMKNDENKIFVAKEYNYPVGEWLFQFPGGGVPYNEDIQEGAQRELREETGFKANSLIQIGWYYPMNRRTDHKMFVFYGCDVEFSPLQKDDVEEFENFWMYENEIDELIGSGEIVNSGMLASWSIFKSSKIKS